MKALITLSLALFSTSLIAQYDEQERTIRLPVGFDWKFDSELYSAFIGANPKETKELGVKGLRRTYYKFSKGEAVVDEAYSSSQKFNQLGLLLEKQSKNLVYAFTYDAEGKNIDGKKVKKGQEVVFRVNEYDTKGNIVGTKLFEKGAEEAIMAKKRAYNEDGKGTEETNYVKGNKLKNRTTWAYHESGALAQVDKYNKKNKLASSKIYDCNENVAKPIKATSLVCVSTEVDEDGNRVEVSRTTNAKGDVFNTKTTFDGKDRTIKRLTYNGLNELRNGWEQTLNEAGKRTTYKRYYGGKLRSRQTMERAEDGSSIVETSYNGKDKITRKRDIVFENNGKTEKGTVYKKGGEKLNHTYIVAYNQKAKPVSIEKFKPNGDPKSKILTEYDYF